MNNKKSTKEKKLKAQTMTLLYTYIYTVINYDPVLLKNSLENRLEIKSKSSLSEYLEE